MATNLAPDVVIAEYASQRMPVHRGNPLIEALPPAWSEEEWESYLTVLPEVSNESRGWPQHERLSMIDRLSTFLRPLARHVRLALAIDSTIRNGYVGRMPDSVEHHALKQESYAAGQRKEGILQVGAKGGSGTAFTSSLIGLSGQGKTTLAKTVCRRYPTAIYHPRYYIYQVPTIYVDAPFGGRSVEAIAISIIAALDRAIPGCDYFERYFAPNREGPKEHLINVCARLMHAHFVGLLVVDEVQFLLGADSNAGTGLSALVSASSALGIPIHFVGTPEAQHLLTEGPHVGCRSVSLGSTQWGALSRSGDLDAPGEWETFLSTLWEYQYLANPVSLTETFSLAMYERTRGIVDLTIKLFEAIQWSAILGRDETITLDTIHSVWEADFKGVHRWAAAAGSSDFKRPDDFEHEQLQVVSLDLQTLGRKGRRSPSKASSGGASTSTKRVRKAFGSKLPDRSRSGSLKQAPATMSDHASPSRAGGQDYRDTPLTNVDDLFDLGH